MINNEIKYMRISKLLNQKFKFLIQFKNYIDHFQNEIFSIYACQFCKFLFFSTNELPKKSHCSNLLISNQFPNIYMGSCIDKAFHITSLYMGTSIDKAFQ